MRKKFVRKTRCSRSWMFCKIGVFKTFATPIGKILCRSLFSKKITGLQLKILMKRWLRHKCFPVNFEIFLKPPFYGTCDCFWKTQHGMKTMPPIQITVNCFIPFFISFSVFYLFVYFSFLYVFYLLQVWVGIFLSFFVFRLVSVNFKSISTSHKWLPSRHLDVQS